MNTTGIGLSANDSTTLPQRSINSPRSLKADVKHEHNYIPKRRLNRILMSACSCGQTKTDLIKDFSKDKAKMVDDYLSELNGQS
jgi:hypothetical protein